MFPKIKKTNGGHPPQLGIIKEFTKVKYVV